MASMAAALDDVHAQARELRVFPVGAYHDDEHHGYNQDEGDDRKQKRLPKLAERAGRVGKGNAYPVVGDRGRIGDVFGTVVFE